VVQGYIHSYRLQRSPRPKVQSSPNIVIAMVPMIPIRLTVCSTN